MSDEKAEMADSSSVEPEAVSDNSASPMLDPVTLVKAITSGTGDPMSMLLAQLGGQASNDPITLALTALLQMRKPAVEVESNSSAEDSLDAKQAELAEQERERAIQELSDTVTRLCAELEVLRKRNDVLAAAIGACFLCFGADQRCPECAGRGHPGAKLPEPGGYRKYVLPALRRARAAQQSRSSSEPSLVRKTSVNGGADAAKANYSDHR